jgi:hypothetical protein
MTAIDHYHELLSKKHLESTAEILLSAADPKHLTVKGRPVCSVLRPLFLEESVYRRVKQVSTVIVRAIARMGDRLMKDDTLRNLLGLSAEEEEIIRIETGYGLPDLSARLDAFFGPQGELAFIEYNADSPGGLGYGDALGELFASMPLLQEFSARYPFRLLPVRNFVFERLVGAYHRWGGAGLPNIGIIDWREASTYGEFLIFKEYFEKQGCQVVIADPSEVEYANGKLRIGSFAVDLVYKRWVVGEMLAKFGLNHPLVQAVRDRAVCMANGFAVQMLFKKTIFPLLSDPAHSGFLDQASLVAIRDHIPWTRFVREGKTAYRDRSADLVSFVLENKDRLVLKPGSEYGGRGVFLGWERTAQEWEQHLKTALADSYVVQERVVMGRESYPQLVDGKLQFEEQYFDLDPYVWDGHDVEGCGVRLSRAALLNVASGGSGAPMFVLQG